MDKPMFGFRFGYMMDGPAADALGATGTRPGTLGAGEAILFREELDRAREDFPVAAVAVGIGVGGLLLWALLSD